MERIIKFRGESIVDGRWYYGDVQNINYGFEIISDGKRDGNTIKVAHPILKYTISQFSGIYDTTAWKDLTKDEQNIMQEVHNIYVIDWKEREIYDGDIISYFEDGSTYVDVVKFSDGAFILERDKTLLSEKEELLVLGNIFDNSNLLRFKEWER